MTYLEMLYFILKDFILKKNISDLYRLDSLIFANHTQHMENNTCAFFEFESFDGTPYILNSYHIKKFTYEFANENTQKRMTIGDTNIRVYKNIIETNELLKSIDDDEIKPVLVESLNNLIQIYLEKNRSGNIDDRKRYANIQEIEKELEQYMT